MLPAKTLYERFGKIREFADVRQGIELNGLGLGENKLFIVGFLVEERYYGYGAVGAVPPCSQWAPLWLSASIGLSFC